MRTPSWLRSRCLPLLVGSLLGSCRASVSPQTAPAPQPTKQDRAAPLESCAIDPELRDPAPVLSHPLLHQLESHSWLTTASGRFLMDRRRGASGVLWDAVRQLPLGELARGLPLASGQVLSSENGLWLLDSLLRPLRRLSPDAFERVGTSANEQFAFGRRESGEYQVFSLRDGTLIGRIARPPLEGTTKFEAVEHLADDGRRLLLIVDGRLVLYDVSTAAVLLSETLPCFGIANRPSVAWHPDGDGFAVALACPGVDSKGVRSFSKEFHLLLLGPGRPRLSFGATGLGIAGGLEFSRDGRWLGMDAGRRHAVLFRVREDGLVQDGVLQSLSPGLEYATLEENRVVALPTRRLATQLDGSFYGWSANGRWMLAGDDEVMRVLDTRSFEPIDQIPYDHFVLVDGRYRVLPNVGFVGDEEALIFSRPGLEPIPMRWDFRAKSVHPFAKAERIPIESAQFLDASHLVLGQGAVDVNRPQVSLTGGGYYAIVDLARARVVGSARRPGLTWGIERGSKRLHVRDDDSKSCSESILGEPGRPFPCTGWSRDGRQRFVQLSGGKGLEVVGSKVRWRMDAVASDLSIAGVAGDDFFSGAASRDGNVVALYASIHDVAGMKTLWLGDARGRRVVVEQPRLLPGYFLGATTDLVVFEREEGVRVVDAAATLAARALRYAEGWSRFSKLGASVFAADPGGSTLAAYAPEFGVMLFSSQGGVRHLGDSRCTTYALELRFSEDGRRVALSCEHSLRVWDATRGRLELRWSPLPGAVKPGMEFSPDGEWLVVPADSLAHLLSIPRRTRIELVLSELEGTMGVVAVSPQGYVDAEESQLDLVLYPDPKHQRLPRSVREASQLVDASLHRPGLIAATLGSHGDNEGACE